jgi:hypothetical protein
VHPLALQSIVLLLLLYKCCSEGAAGLQISRCITAACCCLSCYIPLKFFGPSFMLLPLRRPTRQQVRQDLVRPPLQHRMTFSVHSQALVTEKQLLSAYSQHIAHTVLVDNACHWCFRINVQAPGA